MTSPSSISYLKEKPVSKHGIINNTLFQNIFITLLFFTNIFMFIYFNQKFTKIEQVQYIYRSELLEIFQKELRKSRVINSSNESELDVYNVLNSTGTKYKEINSANSEVRTRDKRSNRARQYTGEDELSVQLQGQNKSWLQLTSYARIPYNAIQEFCSRTRDSCPPGPKGQKGLTGEIGMPGPKGDMGEIGLPGIQGLRGLRGATGMTGPRGKDGRKGQKGGKGKDGVDGRNGLDGAPGLDGIPGRNGIPGISGRDGEPGYGTKGDDGRNGIDGIPGIQGEKGRKGVHGPVGLTGPRGRSGENGIPGSPGLPGIKVYSRRTVNKTTVKDLLIPPHILGTKHKRKIMIVKENDNVRLHCTAAGSPKPLIQWSRPDGRAIATGQWKDVSVTSEILNLTHIRRDHTGTYECFASNGIPPDARKTFQIEVYFEPFIRVNEWKVGAENGTRAVLECHVEAFPIAVLYWENPKSHIIENNSRRHIIGFEQDKNFIWKSKMTLWIINITNEDYGKYHCVAKNDESITRGKIELYQRDPTRQIPTSGTVAGQTHGKPPPNYSELFNDLCPPPVQCPSCPESDNELGRSSLYCLQVQQFGNDTYPGYKNRTTDCLLSAVGKAVFHRETKSDYGSWLRDSAAHRTQKSSEYYWSTLPKHRLNLYEYEDKISFRENRVSRNFTLRFPFTGNSHVVYNGSFFYQRKGQPKFIKYDLSSGRSKEKNVPLLSFTGHNYLYKTSRDYIDFNTDDNGLWAIYGEPRTNNTVVMKIDPDSLMIEYSWNISISHHKFGEMFIVCGVLYGIDSATETNTKIRFALDLYKKKLLDVDLPFNNPFSMTTMLGYNHKEMEIYSWDEGNQLTYPVKIMSIGYNAEGTKGSKN